MAPVSTSATFLEQWLIAIADKKNCKAMSLDLYNEKVSELQAAMANPAVSHTYEVFQCDSGGYHPIIIIVW